MADKIAEKLLLEFPESPDTESFRFAQAACTALEFSRKSNKQQLMEESAIQNLEAYLDWRSCYGIDFDKPELESDAAIWVWSVQKAMEAANSKEDVKRQLEEAEREAQRHVAEPSRVDYDSHIDEAFREEEKDEIDVEHEEHSEKETPSVVDEEESNLPTLPQIIFQRMDPKTGQLLCDKDGNRIFHVLAARIDRYAASNETWALAISLYLDYHFDRESRERYCLLVDARAGKDWKNPTFLMTVPLTRAIIKTVNSIHPGRWESVVIFPLPRALLGVWRTVKGYFHPETVRVMKLVCGPSNLGSPLPKDALEAHVDTYTLECLEASRNELC